MAARTWPLGVSNASRSQQAPRVDDVLEYVVEADQVEPLWAIAECIWVVAVDDLVVAVVPHARQGLARDGLDSDQPDAGPRT